MSWGRMDDKFHRNPKVRELMRRKNGEAALGVWCFWWSWCLDDPKLDGFVPASELNRRASRLANVLISVGLWEEVEGGYRYHDFLEYALSPEKAARKREYDREYHEKRRQRVVNDSDTIRERVVRPRPEPEPEPGPARPDTPTPTASAVSEPQEAKPKRAPSSDAQRFWELYADAFFVDCGSRPTAQAHYFVQINRLLKQHSLEVLAERLKNYFLSPTWIGKGGSRDFGRFVKFIDSWALPDTETTYETVDRLFVKAPERAQAVLANGHTNLLTGGDQK